MQTVPQPNVDTGRRTHEVELESGESESDLEFGNAPEVVIEGVKYHDLNANGTRDADEPGVANWTMFLDLNLDGILNRDEDEQPIEPTAVTAFDDPLTEGVDETAVEFESLKR